MVTWRSPLAVLVALLLFGAPLLPMQHLHRAGIEGRTDALVHAHGLDVPSARACRTALTSGHGDHSRAVFLSGDFTMRSGASVVAPSAASVNLTPPVPAEGAVVIARDAPLIHGPPLRASITRGPPSAS